MASSTYPSLNNTLSRQANAYLAAIIESSDDAIISKNLDGTITSWNEAAVKMYGYTADEIIGKHISLIIPSDRTDEEAHIISRLKQGGKIDHFETVRQHKTGRQFEVSITVSPIRDASGEIIGASKIARDISGRRMLERELESKAKLLIEKDRSKDEFLAMLAHELRNPLAPVSNTLHILASQSIGPERQKELLAMARRQVEHMVRLLDDLLDVSRITHGKIAMRPEKLDLRDVLQSAVDIAHPLMIQRNHQLKLDLPDAPVWMNGDATRLTQLFGNLLNNSAKYTNDGGEISLSIEQAEGQAKIHVRDNGIGIEADRLPYIFDIFMQVDNSMQRQQGGLGIGLTLVKSIAELHSGKIDVRSKGKNMGTEFIVTLPVMAVTDQMKSGQENQNAISSRQYRVMVVDDNEAAAKTLGWMLEALGHDVRVALNPKDAMQTAENHKPQVILLDIGMPLMNGYDLRLRLKESNNLKDCIFIAQTGWGQKQDIERSKESGFDYHLIKPISIETLQQQMETLEPALQH